MDKKRDLSDGTIKINNVVIGAAIIISTPIIENKMPI
jgi:hypothetical protein